MTAIPPHAERIDGIACLTVARKPSRYLPGREVFVPTFTCPGCNRLRPERPQHSVTFICEGCGLHMQMLGGDLFVWPATVPADA